MRAEAILIRWLAAPLLIPVGWAQVGDHNGDGVARAGAVALAGSSDSTDVGELVAFPAPGPAPRTAAPGAGEEVLAAGCGVDVRAAGGGLPGGHGGAGGAATGAGLPVVVVRCGCVAGFGAGVGGAGARGEGVGGGRDGGGLDRGDRDGGFRGGGFGKVGVGEGAGQRGGAGFSHGGGVGVADGGAAAAGPFGVGGETLGVDCGDD